MTTLETLEKIKAELQRRYWKTIQGKPSKRNGYNNAIDDALQIIDKYAEQESSRDMEEIAEIMRCDVDAETKCKMISNILTAKPHYFAEQEPTSPCDLCIFDRMDGDNKYCGYCGECPATAKGGE